VDPRPFDSCSDPEDLAGLVATIGRLAGRVQDCEGANFELRKHTRNQQAKICRLESICHAYFKQAGDRLLPTESLPITPSVKAIKQAVCRFFHLKEIELLRPAKRATRPRHIAAYLACTLTTHNSTFISRALGYTDRSVVSRINKASRLAKLQDPEFVKAIRAIEEMLLIPT
jgi:chromosomal replication initiation ATPase DnaA